MLDGAGGSDELIGDAFFVNDQAQGGNDLLRGGDARDRLLGDARFMEGSARGGRDVLLGGPGDDDLFGDARQSVGAVVGGSDRLDGGPGNDTLVGDLNNSLNATTAAELFLFAVGGGNDTIRDFGPGEDRLVVSGFPGLTRDGLLAGAEELGDDLLLDPGEAAGGSAGVDTVRLNGIELSDLGPGDILVA